MKQEEFNTRGYKNDNILFTEMHQALGQLNNQLAEGLHLTT